MRTFLASVVCVLLQVTLVRAQNPESYSGNYWIPICKSARESEQALCLAYLRGMNDLNDMLRALKRPLWCEPSGVTLNQIRLVVIADLEKTPENLHYPFAGSVMVALGEKFPCGKPG